MKRLEAWLGRPVSGASLAALRAAFGAVMIYQAYEFVEPIGASSKFEKIRILVRHVQHALRGESAEPTVLVRLFTGPHVAWNFGFPGLEWIRPLPEPWMTTTILLLAAASALLMIGLATRAAAVVVGAIYTYLWMIETTWWNNHFYLSSLFCLLLAATPCNRCFSVDRWLVGRKTGGGQWDGLIPFWPVLLFRAQMFLVYFYAAVVKMNADWLSGEPIRTSMRERTVARPLAEYLSPSSMEVVYSILGSEPVVYLIALGGLVFDLSIGFLLCIRRTKWLALTLVLMFHGANFWIFNIGAFPVLGVAATLIFFDPDWPIRFGRWLRRPTVSPPDPGWMLAGMLAVPIVGAALGWRVRPSEPLRPSPPPQPVGPARIALLSAYLAVQTLLPLRHLAIEGDVHWTGEGGKFAWQMMARAHSGHVRYRLQDPAWPAPDGAPHPKIEWPRIEGAAPAPIFHDVDSHRPTRDWFGEIVVVFEPFVGERIFFNPGDGEDASFEAAERRVGEIWRNAYGRVVAAQRTRPLADVLQDLIRRRPRTRTDALDREWSEFRRVGRSLIERDAAFRERGPTHPTNLEDRLRWQADLGRFLAIAGRLAMPEAMAEVYRSRAFDLFGGFGPNWLLVFDPELQTRGNLFYFTRVSWSEFRFDQVVWTDFTRLPSDVAKLLPERMFGYDRSGQPVVFWNAERDLVPFPQFQGHVALGTMIHQYANGRIARFWEEQTGVRPRVFVDSYAKLNQHPLQPLVDPNVDLASVPLRIFSHNPWILPMQARHVVVHVAGAPQYRLQVSPDG
jgi:hypothetical protein